MKAASKQMCVWCENKTAKVAGVTGDLKFCTEKHRDEYSLAQVSNPAHTPKEDVMKTKTAKKAVKLHKIANVIKGSKKHFTHPEIVLAVRASGLAEKELVATALKFGVEVVKGELREAPNAGVLKMRTANVIRGALARAGLFTGEIARVPRGKQVKKAKSGNKK
jgi:hypothetical protein